MKGIHMKFRELTRKNKTLSREQCIALLKGEKRGVLSVLGDGDYPYGTPMNHVYSEADGCIYFHCGRAGHRLDAIAVHDKVSFCVYNEGERLSDMWALTVQSVIVFGRVEVIDDMKQVVEITAQLCHKFTHDEDYIQREIKTHAKATLLLKLTPEHICGKQVLES